MTPTEFRAWRKSLGLSQKAAAEAIGVSESMIGLYESGRKRDADRSPCAIPRTVALACAAVSAGIEPVG